MSKKVLSLLFLVILALTIAVSGCGKSNPEPVPSDLQVYIDKEAAKTNNTADKNNVKIIASTTVESENGQVVLAQLPEITAAGETREVYFIFDKETKQVATVDGRTSLDLKATDPKYFSFILEPNDPERGDILQFAMTTTYISENYSEYVGIKDDRIHYIPVQLHLQYKKPTVEIEGFFTGRGYNPSHYQGRLEDPQHIKFASLFAKALPAIYEQFPNGYYEVPEETTAPTESPKDDPYAASSFKRIFSGIDYEYGGQELMDEVIGKKEAFAHDSMKTTGREQALEKIALANERFNGKTIELLCSGRETFISENTPCLVAFEELYKFKYNSVNVAIVVKFKNYKDVNNVPSGIYKLKGKYKETRFFGDRQPNYFNGYCYREQGYLILLEDAEFTD